MIWEGIVSAFVWIVNGVVSLIPTDAPPAWLNDGAGYLNTLMESAAGLGAWIPWSLAVTVLGAVLSCVVIGFTIKVVRIVASFLTVGGGSAG